MTDKEKAKKGIHVVGYDYIDERNIDSYLDAVSEPDKPIKPATKEQTENFREHLKKLGYIKTE